MKIVFTEEADIKDFLGNGLDGHNRKFNENIIPYENKKEFGFYAYDGEVKVGGVCGYTDMGNWAFVDLLFVDEKYRSQDIGTTLIKEVEKFAGRENCIGVYLTTWSWQAKGFYEKMGFEQFGELKNHPKGGSKFYMKKDFSNHLC